MTQSSLPGCWLLVDSPSSIDAGDRVEMMFEPSGRMIYGILQEDRWQLMILTYRVDGNFIISDQPSHPSEERTRFSFSAPDTLEMEYAGEISTLQRIPSCSFPVPEKRKSLLERLGFTRS